MKGMRARALLSAAAAGAREFWRTRCALNEDAHACLRAKAGESAGEGPALGLVRGKLDWKMQGERGLGGAPDGRRCDGDLHPYVTCADQDDLSQCDGVGRTLSVDFATGSSVGHGNLQNSSRAVEIAYSSLPGIYLSLRRWAG